jgi:hypothetical protein
LDSKSRVVAQLRESTSQMGVAEALAGAKRADMSKT